MNLYEETDEVVSSYGQTAVRAASERLLSVAQAAQEVGCSTDTIRRAYMCNELQVMRIGSRIKVRCSHLADWLNRGGKTR